jgi:Glycosyl transferases group 1
MNLFVLSEMRPELTHVGWSVNYSLEEALKEVLNPTFIYPQEKHPLGLLHRWGVSEETLEPWEGRVNRLLGSWFTVKDLPTLGKGPNVLLIIGLMPDFLLSLHALGPLLQQFDLRLAYLLDGFNPKWLHPSLLPHLDHLFVISSELADEVRQMHGIDTTFLPLAANTTKLPFSGSPRCIDVINYGRGNEAVHQCLQQHFNQHNHGRVYFHSTFEGGVVTNLQEHIALMRKLLSRSKLSLCFEASNIPRFRGQSPLLYRWFEAWSAGCTIVGKRPFGNQVMELLDWENSTFEIPDSQSEWAPFVEALLEDETTLALNAERNRQECMLRHDWRYRIQDIFSIAGLPIAESLQASIQHLQKQALDMHNSSLKARV